MRSIRFLISELEAVVSNLPVSVDQSSNFRCLIEAICFWVAATSRDAGTASLIRRAFSSTDLGIVLAMHDMRKKRTDDAPADDDQLDELLTRFKLREAAMNWPHSKEFVSLVGGGNVDHEQLAKEFGLINVPRNITDPLDELQHYRRLEDPDIQMHIGALIKELKEFRSGSLQRWFDIYKTIHFVSVSGLTKEEPDAWADTAKGLLASLDPSGDFQNVEYFFPPSDATEQAVRKELDDFQGRASDARAARERAQVRAALLAGEKVEERISSDFRDADPKAFFLSLHAASPAVIFGIATYFRSRLRIGNGPSFYGADRPFADRLAKEIRKKIKAVRPMALKNAALLELADILEKVVAQIKNYEA